MSCCQNDLGEIFNDDFARKEIKRYRRRGLPARARKLLAAVEQVTELNEKTTLEIGAGAGALTVELLRRGAATATAVDAVPAMIAAARVLADEFNVGDRLQLVQADFAENASSIESADVVVLDRVICCYPDWASMLSAAAVRARQVLVMTYPRDTALWRAEAKVFNAVMRIFRKDFTFHVHPADRMQKLLDTYNLTPRVAGRHFMWEILIATHR
jgi:2-polyprenyl-3-methyl-5-hydroxy-6-metoxy-1,4-benzoquinol methylase